MAALAEPERRSSAGDLTAAKADRRPLRVCMLAYTFYESDGRVMRYAEALAAEGAEVEAIVLRKPGQPPQEMLGGVNVLRIQERQRNEKRKVDYFGRILAFFFRSMLAVRKRQEVGPYDLVHVHSVPDFEVFAAIFAKFRGAKIILDIHDIVPEFYAAKFNIGETSAVFKLLKLVERASTGFADHVIAANDLWAQKIISRSVPARKCSAYINYPDSGIFYPGLRTRRDDDRFVVLYPGSLNWHQGLDIAIKAVSRALPDAPGLELHIYGEGSAKPALEALAEELHLGDKVTFRPPLPIREIAVVMANADLGLVPKRDDPFGGEAFSTKILEFMALGIPLVVAATRIDRYYFDDSVVRFFRPEDEDDLARALVNVYVHRAEAALRARRGLEHAAKVSWEKKKASYLQLVGTLLRRGS